MEIKNTSKKIAIVGAGPAGILAGVELMRAGYSNITIFGHFEEAQCHTMKIGGVVADVGTCYLHFGYFNTIKKLVKQFDINIDYLQAEPDSVYSSDVNTSIEPSTKEKIFAYLGLIYFLFHSIAWMFLKNSVVGTFLYGRSFEQYLKYVGLNYLTRSFIFGPGGVAQGYGSLRDVSAYRLFRWFRPSIFLTPMMSKHKRGTGIIREGYATLFKRAYDSIPARIGLKVSSVKPIANHEVEITLMDGSKATFDTAIVACPVNALDTPLSNIVSNKQIHSSSLFSYLWTSKHPPSFSDRVYLLDHINRNRKDLISTYRIWGKTEDEQYLYWGVGYCSNELDREVLKQKVMKQVNDQLKLPVSENHFFQVYSYNLRLSIEAIRNGTHRKISRMQGQGNIWYSGGMLSHWDVDSIHEFDMQLVNQLVYKNNKSLINFIRFHCNRLKSFFTNV